jgi:uncharacterized protein
LLKRKYGDRHDWQRIIKRRYAQSYVDTEDFSGHITLIDMIKVREPLMISYGEKELCLVDDGYRWLQQFPFGKNHMVTTTFDHKGNIVQWYIDICREYEMDNGIPIIDDLFLDIVVLPTGEVFLLDKDELEEAFAVGLINQALYNLAWDEAKRLLKLIEKNEFKPLELSVSHKEHLEGIIENRT